MTSLMIEMTYNTFILHYHKRHFNFYKRSTGQSGLLMPSNNLPLLEFRFRESQICIGLNFDFLASFVSFDQHLPVLIIIII